MAKNGTFFWYDLLTSDVPAALKFYEAVVGWNTEPFPNSPGGYVVLKAGETGIGGVMGLPNAQQPPAWLGYIKSADTDADAKSAVTAGGRLLKGPEDIPGEVGGFPVISDPNGAAYFLLNPNGPDGDGPAPMTPGTVGWSEYMGDDWEKAFAYYEKLHGWEKIQAVDMGDMGTYQLVGIDGQMFAGMMNRPPQVPVSNWGFYFAVEGIDAAKQRVLENGGTIITDPMQVPGDQWVLNAQDPQGAYFSLVSDTK